MGLPVAEPAPQPTLPRLILDAARALLLTDGVGGLSMRKIAQRIGYSPTALYLHFPHKDAILHALLDEGLTMLHERLATARAGSAGEAPVQRVRALADAYVRWGLDNPARYEVMFLLHPRHMERYPPEKFREARRTLGLFAEVLIDAGIPDAVARVRSSSIWAQVHGLVALELARRLDTRLPEEAVRAAVLDAVVGAALAPV